MKAQEATLELKRKRDFKISEARRRRRREEEMEQLKLERQEIEMENKREREERRAQKLMTAKPTNKVREEAEGKSVLHSTIIYHLMLVLMLVASSLTIAARASASVGEPNQQLGEVRIGE